MIDDSKITFLYAAISDLQSTIRAVDTKLTVFCVLLFLPFTNIDKILPVYTCLFDASDNSCMWFLKLLVVSLSLIFWTISILSAIFGLSAIDNPFKKVTQMSNANGCFYRGGLIQLGLLQAILPFNNKMISLTLENALQNLPESHADMIKELQFEQLKMVYIRELKFARLKYSIRFGLIWILTITLFAIYNKV